MYLGKQSHQVLIEGKRLNKITSIEIEKDIKLLSDTATIKLSGFQRDLTLEVEKKIKRGNHITIAVGYNDDNDHEFEGYVKSVSTNNDITIKCEDRMFEFYKAVTAQKLKSVSVEDIITHMFKDIKGYELKLGKDVDSIRFTDFTIKQGSTAHEVLALLKKKTGLNIYLRGNELHMQLRHLTDRGNTIELDFRKHIHQSSLKYIDAKNTLLHITVNSTLKDGTTLTATHGQSGGDTMDFVVHGVENQAALDTIAKNYYDKRIYTGVDGTVSCSLTPYLTVGDHAKLISPNYPQREGTYFIETEKISYSQSNDERVVGLGALVNMKNDES